MSNPCGSFEWFTQSIDDLTKGQQRLTAARMYLHTLIKLAQDQRSNRTKILEAYLAVVERIGENPDTGAAAAKVAVETQRRAAEAWIHTELPPGGGRREDEG
jgi:hypothetical protein